jgi:hypothetical protein
VSVPAATAAGRSRTLATPASPPAPLRLPPAPRRVSGPARHPRAASAQPVVASPRWLALIDHPSLDRLIRGRVWIGIVAAALLGIVAMQVVLLRLGAQISAQTTAVNALIAHNETASTTIAGMEATGGAYGASATAKMVDPPPDDVTYMHANSSDLARAVARMRSPSAAAIAAEAAARTYTAATTITPAAAIGAATVTTAPSSAGATGATGATAATGTTSAAGGAAATGAPAGTGATGAAASTTTTPATTTPATTTPATTTPAGTTTTPATTTPASTTTTPGTTTPGTTSAGTTTSQGGAVVAPASTGG